MDRIGHALQRKTPVAGTGVASVSLRRVTCGWSARFSLSSPSRFLLSLARTTIIALVCMAAVSSARSQPQVTPKSGSANARDPRQTLVSAKTAVIVAQSGEVAQTGRWVMDPNPERAANALQKALQKWGRLAVVENSVQADLVLLIIEGNRSSFLKKGELFEKLIVLPGGPGAVQEKTPLWQEEAKEGLGGRPAGKLVEHFRKQVEDL
jgi:hypothetical protein